MSVGHDGFSLFPTLQTALAGFGLEGSRLNERGTQPYGAVVTIDIEHVSETICSCAHACASLREHGFYNPLQNTNAALSLATAGVSLALSLCLTHHIVGTVVSLLPSWTGGIAVLLGGSQTLSISVFKFF